jgi:hypothetical protein
MSPPIRDGSGSSIGSIRLGDGSEISEVRTGAGDVLFSAGPPDNVIDNFETAAGSPQGIYETGDTLSTYYNGATGAWSRTTSDVIQGSFAAEKTSASLSDHIFSTPGDGLNTYPNTGDTIGWLVRSQDTGSGNAIGPGPIVSASSGVNGYLYALGDRNGEIIIWKLGSGSYETSVSTSATVASNTWFWAEGTVPSSSLDPSWQLYNLNQDLTRGSQIASITFSDGEYRGRGIGLSNASSDVTGTVLDWIRVL